MKTLSTLKLKLGQDNAMIQLLWAFTKAANNIRINTIIATSAIITRMESPAPAF
jgi:hypothetical protein